MATDKRTLIIAMLVSYALALTALLAIDWLRPKSEPFHTDWNVGTHWTDGHCWFGTKRVSCTQLELAGDYLRKLDRDYKTPVERKLKCDPISAYPLRCPA